MKHHTQMPQATLTPTRRRIFFCLILLIPFVVILSAEAILRLIEYGGNLDLVVRTDFGGREYYRINRTVGRRYFAHSVTGIPEPAEDVFEIHKRKNTIRIFCLGESTMAGFPYEFHATVPSFLKDRLDSLLPDHHLEIINVGLAAVGSFVVKDFVDELAQYQPDLYVIYMGHNEFYGAFGVGSSVGVSGGAWMNRLHLALLQFKTYQAMRDLLASLSPTAISPEKSRGTLMSQMVGEQIIPYHGDVYNRSREIFKENLERIIASTREQNVPIIFTSLVSNLKDQKPFAPIFAEATSDSSRAHCQSLLTQSESLLESGNASTAEQKSLTALALDCTYAATHFMLGRISLALQDFGTAREQFVMAKDFDALRFRASTEFENDLIAVCKANGVPVARADSAFLHASPDGIVGTNLILEHLHPNIDGYFLMAKTIANTIRHSHLVTKVSWHDDAAESDSVLMEHSMVSEFDKILGRIKIDLLMQRWPFTEKTGEERFTPNGPAEELVYRYVRGNIAWSDARYALADYYAGIKRYDLARKECLAVSKVLFFSYQPLLRVADYFRDEGKNDDAKRAYEQCLHVEENPFARMKLAIMFLEEERPVEAEQEIRRAFDAAQRGHHKLSVSASSSARYLLGVVLAQQNKYREARESLQHSLTLQPDHREAAELLQQLQGMGPQ
ncbi:MAG: tetratricopeptide repeat protein [Bacteroidota bacterium]